MNKPIILADGDGIRYLETKAPRPAGEKGFSLVEVLLAAGLISFLLAGTAELMLQSINVTRKSNRTISLSGLMASEVDEFKSKPFDAPELETGSYAILVHTDPDRAPVRIEWTVENVSENLKKVNFKLTRDGQAGRVLEAVLLITRELALR